MDKASNDAASIQVLLGRLNEQRLPRALSLKEKVERGDTLNEFDIQFLKEVLEDAHGALALADRHPQFRPLVAQLTSLYGAITSKAVENEPKT